MVKIVFKGSQFLGYFFLIVTETSWCTELWLLFSFQLFGSYPSRYSTYQVWCKTECCIMLVVYKMSNLHLFKCMYICACFNKTIEVYTYQTLHKWYDNAVWLTQHLCWDAGLISISFVHTLSDNGATQYTWPRQKDLSDIDSLVSPSTIPFT